MLPYLSQATHNGWSIDENFEKYNHITSFENKLCRNQKFEISEWEPLHHKYGMSCVFLFCFKCILTPFDQYALKTYKCEIMDPLSWNRCDNNDTHIINI